MTMLIAPGAGTNIETGSAHRSAFNDLAAAELPLSDSELAAVQRWQGGISADAVKRDFSAAYGELAKAVLPLLARETPPVFAYRLGRAATAANAEGSVERPCRAAPARAFRLLPEGGVKKWPPSGPLSEERGARL